MRMAHAVDSQLPDLLSSPDTDGTPEKVDSIETSDTIDDDTWSTYSTDDENEKSYLHGLSFLDETDEWMF
jgi:hypothetical protein